MESLSSEKVNINESTQYLREKLRIFSQSIRGDDRVQKIDSLRFGLNEIQQQIEDIKNLNEKDVEGIAKPMKRRKHATKDDMYRLSHSFIQSLNNIKTFSKIQGAFHVLVKELTGGNIVMKIYAAECFCNLSLGEREVCEKIATMAGSYLVTFLDGSELQLKRLSLWTIANIVATSFRATKSLNNMALWPKLWSLYTSDSNEIDLVDYAGICMMLIAQQDQISIREEYLIHLSNNFHQKNPTTSGSQYLLMILHCSNVLNQEKLSTLNETQTQYLLNFAIRNIKEVNLLNTFEERISLIYAIRTLGNLLACRLEVWKLFLQQLSHVWHENLVHLLNKLFDFRDQNITKETLWLLKNMLLVQQNNDSSLVCLPLEKIRIHGPLPSLCLS